MLPQHDDLENPPEYTQLRDDYWSALAELTMLRKREDILVAAMSEVKATNEGKSTKPISRIVAGCIAELSALANDNNPAAGSK